MKNLLYAAIVLLTLAACKDKKAIAEAEPVAKPAPAPTTLAMQTPEQAFKDSIVIEFEKSPCFGRCPVYNVKVYGSGFALYEGINFTEKMGMYTTKFTKQEIDEIVKIAEAINYDSLKDEYDDKNVMDLPSTYSAVRIDGKLKRIKARMDVPLALKNFNENLSVTLLEKKWVEYSDY